MGECEHDWIFFEETRATGQVVIGVNVPTDEPLEDYEDFAAAVTSMASKSGGSLECELYSHGDQLDHRIVIFHADGTCRVGDGATRRRTRDFVIGLQESVDC